MSDNEIFTLTSSPESQGIESIPPHPDVQRLHDIFHVDYGMDNVMLGASIDMRQVFDRVKGTYIDPRQQKAIEIIYEEINYTLFAFPGTELPSSLVMSQYTDGGRHIERHPELYFEMPDSHDERIFFAEVLRPAGMDIVSQYLVSEMDFRKPPIIEALRTWIKEQPEYQFLASFDTKPPQPKDQPLTAHWRQIRERQLESEIRRKHGLEDSGPLHQAPFALNSLRRAVYRLDDETMPRSNEDDGGDPFTKLRNFFTANVDKTLAYFRQREIEDPEGFDVSPGETNYPDGPWKVKRHDGSAVITLSNGDDHYGSELVEHEEFAGTHRRHYGFNISNSAFYDEAFDILFNEAFDNFFGEKFSGRFSNFQEYLNSVVDAYAERMFEARSKSIKDSFSSPRSQSFSGIRQRLPSAQVIDYQKDLEWRRQFYELNNKPSRRWSDNLSLRRTGNQNISLTSLEEMERQERRTMGIILNIPDSMSSISRVINLTSVSPNMPPVDMNAADQLLIQTDGYSLTYNHQTPFIPGFNLVARHQIGDTFLAYRAAEHDPYQPARVPLDYEQSNLIHTYSRLGFQRLAVRLNSIRDATVQDLADSIHESAVYQLLEDNDTFPDRLKPKVLDDFLPLIRDGRLHVQCDGANAFLRLSLESIFGPGSAVEHSGYILNPATPRISGALHAQTIFTHQGKSYILDATPAGQPALSQKAEEIHWQKHEIHESVPAAATLIPLADIKMPEPIALKSLTAKHQDVGLQQLVDQLEAQLTVVFEAPNRNGLYKKLVSLPKHDPARSTLKLLKQALAGQPVTHQEIERQLSYIKNVSNANPLLRRQLKLGTYDDALLAPLGKIMERLGSLMVAGSSATF